jgi:dipeptidyl aminopeptidase/acylaminoacyl peptidase
LSFATLIPSSIDPLSAASMSRNLEPEDYFRIKYLGGPQISPDGDEIAYTVSQYDEEMKESSSQVWTVSFDGSRRRLMTSADQSSSEPRYSPDGKYLAFTSARDDGETQIWLLPRRGGEARPATEVEQGVGATVFLEGAASSAGDYAWSPDSTRILMVLKDPKPEEDRSDNGDDDTDKDEEEDEEVAKPWVINRRQFKLDYEGYLDNRRAHIHVLDIATQTLTQVTSGEFDDLHPTWSPDGKRIAFTSNRSEMSDSNYNNDIWVVDVGKTEAISPPRRLTSDRGAERYPAWSPDGKSIAYVGAKLGPRMYYLTNYLAVVDVETGKEEILTPSLDRNISTPQYSPDGDWIYFSLEDQGEQNLARIPSGGGETERLITGTNTLAAFEVGPNGEIAARITQPDRPSEIFVLEKDGKLVPRTDVNGDFFSQVSTGQVEKIEFESPDGTAVEALVVKPPGFRSGTKYPTILYLHGGPQSQHDYSFEFDAQLWAANGYLVVMPNPRGSTGYGEEFCLGIWQDWGGPDFEDVMASVDAVIDRGWADPDRLAVTGWSYGGMLTNHVITKTDRFKAAITGASATLYIVNYGHDQYQRWWEDEVGLPWEPEARKLWEKMSPFNRVQHVVTPTLIVGGEHDWNVPIINSEQLFMALARLGVETELVVYPGEHHTIRTPSYILDLAQRYLDWFDKYTGGGADDQTKG